ncbi:hypothetical protein NHQ30_003641 [Ciborinia camelliae]|nr:hypothetical protein NHQ30_003641 [Ciborinia camelliae]
MANNPMGTCPLGGLTAANFSLSSGIPAQLKYPPSSDVAPVTHAMVKAVQQLIFEQQDLELEFQTPSFQGCCDNNPCLGNGTTCPQSQLYPAAFKSVTTSPNFTGSEDTTFQTATLPMATFSTVAITGAEPTNRSPVSENSGLARITPWNTTAYSTQASMNFTNSTNGSTTASDLYFHTLSSSYPTDTEVPNTSSIFLGNTNSTDSAMTAGPSTVTITSILTFTAVRISVYTVSYSLSDSTSISDSSSLPKTTATSISNPLMSLSMPSPLHAAGSTSLPPATITTLPPSTIPDSKLVAWGATGGVAFLLIFTFVSWWLRRRKKTSNNNSEKIIGTASSITWLPWRRRKELPRTSLSTYPFRGMAPSTSTDRGEVNETWSASLRDYRNLGGMAAVAHSMNNPQPRTRVPARLSGYESTYSQKF